VQAQKEKELKAKELKRKGGKQTKQVVPSAQPKALFLTETLQFQGRAALPLRDKVFGAAALEISLRF
jgi:hypothetical protein